MSAIWRALLACLVVSGLGGLFTLGCDTLFPELSGPPRDAGIYDGGGDGGAPPHLAGTICILGDPRDYRSCASGAPGPLRITVEETRQQAMTDVTGRFTMPLATRLVTATVAVVDPRGVYATSIVPVALHDGAADLLALPVLQAQTLAELQRQHDITLPDPARGTVVAWAVDPNGTPVNGVAVQPANASRDGSALYLFDLAPTGISVTLRPPAQSGLAGDQFSLPIRAGAVTLTRLVLPPQ